MTIDRYLIATPRVGMEKDLIPDFLPIDAYPDLQDCYLFRGRVKKREGYTLLGRLNRQIGTTDGSGNATITLVNIPITSGISSFNVGTEFFQDGGTGGTPVTLLTNGPGSATLNLSTGVLTILGAPINTAIFYYPGLPVMGLRTQETVTIDQTSLIAFDTSFAYKYNNSSSKFVDASTYKTSGGVVNWTGPNYQSFWTTNYADALWATNYNAGYQSNPTATTAGKGDGIRWFDEDQSGWVNFVPQITSSNYLLGCLMILPYKGYLICLNTIEGPSSTTFPVTPTGNPNLYFQQRARWNQQLATPYYTTPVPTNYQGGSSASTWRSDTVGNGGFIDATTNEAIVSAEFVKDTLIVYFERSTWQLRYTGNPLLPFIWEKINTELGCESTFSTVPFDKNTVAIGNVGVHSCDSVNVQRIDDRNPDDIFEIEQDNNGPQRVCGIRDFLNELVLWSMPIKTYNSEGQIDYGETPTFPNKMLVYNYRDNCFSYFNDSFTSLGYIQAIVPGSTADLTWQNAQMTWESADFPWISPIEDAQVVRVVGGNQQGFVELLSDDVANDISLFISNVTIVDGSAQIYSPNHNLETGMYVLVVSCSGITGIVGSIFEVQVPLSGSTPDPNNFILLGSSVSGAFTGSGTLAVVNNISILSKKFNPYMEEAVQSRICYMDLYLDATSNGSLTVNLYLNSDNSIPVNSNTNLNLSSNLVNTFPESTYQASPDTNLANQRLWKRIYFQTIGQTYQYQITLNPAQMVDLNVRQSDIVLHGVMMYFSKAGRLIDV